VSAPLFFPLTTSPVARGDQPVFIKELPIANTRRSKPKFERYDPSETFKLLNRADRAIRSLSEPLRQAKRSETNRRKIKEWTYTKSINPPGSFWNWWASMRIDQLLRANPYERTVRDVFDDFLHEVWMGLRPILWGLGYTILTAVAYVIWFWLLIFVVLPVLWDWFWRMPPGLQ